MRIIPTSFADVWQNKRDNNIKLNKKMSFTKIKRLLFGAS